jgi:hypothetical protein
VSNSQTFLDSGFLAGGNIGRIWSDWGIKEIVQALI